MRVGRDWLVADSLDRLVASLGWKLGWLEGRERRLIARSVRPGMVAVDVGANIGVHTLALARAVSPGGRVYAIEPEPRNFRALATALELSGLEHVSLSRAAAGERSAPTRLHLSAANRGDHRVAAAGASRASIEVAGVALDDLLEGEPRVDFVKIDVQGGEAAVLRGMVRTLARSPDLTLLCELCPRLLEQAGSSFESFFAPLAEAGLAPRLVDAQGGLRAVDPEQAWSRAVRSGYLNVAFRRR